MSELAAAEERWRLTIDSAPVGIALTDLHGRFLHVNESLCHIVGHPSEAIVGRTFHELEESEEVDRYVELRAQLLAGATPLLRLRRHYVHPDGALVWADHRVIVVRNASGEPLHFVTYVDDVTEQVESAERIEQMNQDLIEQKMQLERSNDDLEAFAALASHDLQAPLGTVRGYLELISGEYGDVLGDQGRTWLDRASEATGRMSTLLTSLLDYSRAAGSGAPQLEAVDVGGLVGEVTADLADLVAGTGTSVRLDSSPRDIICDRNRLHQVLQNLIQNAVKYRHPDREPIIEVGVEEQSDRWQLTVSDNGVGVPVEDRERVFTMFQQSGPHRPGYGVGLALSRRIVERHGGRIWIEDNPGGGSRLCFTVPRPEGA